MPFTLKTIDTQRVDLDLPTDIDPDQNTWVMIAQATQRENEARAELTATAARTYTEGSKSVKVEQRWSPQEQRRLEVFLTLSACNIVRPDGTELFKFGSVNGVPHLVDEVSFKKAWGQLPSAVAKEIHRAVLVVNPDWNPDTTEGE